MNARLAVAALASSMLLVGGAQAQATGTACGPPTCYITVWNATEPGDAFSFATAVTRTAGSAEPLRDFTVAALLVASNGPGVDQWVFGAATEAWAQPGSHSVLVGLESAVINMEPSNEYAKVAHNSVMKNRPDGAPDPGQPMNHNSMAYFISAQPGTGFERGLVFDRDALLAQGSRPVAIDFSDIPDDRIAGIDLIRIRKDVTLRYDPATKQLVLHVDSPASDAPKHRSTSPK